MIPKTVRDMLGIDVGNEMMIEVDKDRIILTKRSDPMEVFKDVRKRHGKKLTMKKIKEDLDGMYSEK